MEAGYAAGRRELMQTVIIYITKVEISNHIGDWALEKTEATLKFDYLGAWRYES